MLDQAITALDRYARPLDPSRDQEDALNDLAELYDSIRVSQADGLNVRAECFNDDGPPVTGQWCTYRSRRLAADYEIGEDGEFVHGIGDG